MSRIIARISIVVLIACSVISATAAAQDAVSEKAVLITGASSGIGRLTTEGYFVYAGVRKASDKAILDDPQSSEGPAPGPVADAIQHALFAERPKEHYLVVPEQFQAMITISKALEEVLFLNHDHEYSYTREQLIALMDEQQALLSDGVQPELVPDD